MGEWISVNDRLPETEGEYIVHLVYSSGARRITSDFFTNNYKGFIYSHVGKKRGNVMVTHWMPLPEPPKEEWNGCDMLYALADIVLQFGYSTKYKGRDALYDGGLSALEGAFSVLEHHGMVTERNGVVLVDSLLQFMKAVEADCNVD